jgi:hypothetical protein
MTLNDYDNTYSIPIEPNVGIGPVDVIFVDHDSLAGSDWCVLDATQEMAHLGRADCEGLQGGLGI